jgi:hypothetical protein
MLLPLAETGIPITTVAFASSLSFSAAVPMRYIMRLSMFSRLAVFAAEPRAMPKSKALKRHVGPEKSSPSFFAVSSNSSQLL